MKKSELRKLVHEVLLKEGHTYWVLPPKSIEELWEMRNWIDDLLYKPSSKGNDFKMDVAKSLIKNMEKIVKSAKEVPAGQPHPEGYGPEK